MGNEWHYFAPLASETAAGPVDLIGWSHKRAIYYQ
jgi:hypothetical protein